MSVEIGRLGEQQKALEEILSGEKITQIYNHLGDPDKIDNLLNILGDKFKGKEGNINLLEPDNKGNRPLLLVGFLKGRKRLVGVATDFDPEDSSLTVFYADNYRGKGEMILRKGSF